jgi:predicted transcriptional regulator
MDKNLLNILFTSSLVKDILLLLRNGKRDIWDILATFDVNRQALFPQIRMMEEWNLISVSEGSCQLTVMGRMISEKMIPLINTLELLSAMGKYNMDFIPSHLLTKMSDIGPCTVFNPSPLEICEANKEFQTSSVESKSVMGMTTFLFPNFRDIFSEYMERDISVSVIITGELFNKLKKERSGDLKWLLGYSNMEMYRYDNNIDLISFTLNDYGIMLRLLSNSDQIKYDYKHILLQSPGALSWGRELFDYYRNKSVLITDI